MGQKGLDFKHKEVVNITDGKRLRICARRNSWFRNRDDYIYNGCKKENRCSCFMIERERRKKDYITKNNQKRTGYVVREKFEYDVVCKVEL